MTLVGPVLVLGVRRKIRIRIKQIRWIKLAKASVDWFPSCHMNKYIIYAQKSSHLFLRLRSFSNFGSRLISNPLFLASACNVSYEFAFIEQPPLRYVCFSKPFANYNTFVKPLSSHALVWQEKLKEWARPWEPYWIFSNLKPLTLGQLGTGAILGAIPNNTRCHSWCSPPRDRTLLVHPTGQVATSSERAICPLWCCIFSLSLSLIAL